MNTPSSAHTYRKGDAVKGRYMGVEFTGTVRSARLNERSRNVELEIDFPSPLAGFRGRDWDVRNGLILTQLGEDDHIEHCAQSAGRPAPVGGNSLLSSANGDRNG